MTRSIPFAAALLVACLAAVAVTEEPEQLVRVSPSRHESSEPVRWGAPLIAGSDEGPPLSAPHAALEDYEVPLAELLGPELTAAGGDVMPMDGGVLVEGADAIALARRHVAEIERFVQGRGVFRVSVVHVPGGDGSLDADGVRAAVAGGSATVLWASRLTALRGENVVRGEIEESPFVGFIDVEIAQNASISDPQIMRLETGLRVGLWQRPLDERRTRAFLSLQLSRLDGRKQVQVAAGHLDLPQASFAAVGAPLLLEAGAPQVVVFDHPWEDGVVAAVVEALELPAAPDLPVRLVDVAAVAGIDVAPPITILGIDDGTRWEEDETDPTRAAQALGDALDAAYDDCVRLTTSVYAVPRDAAVPEPPPAVSLRRRVWSVPASELASFPGYDALDGTVERDGGLAALEGRERLCDARLAVSDGTRSWCVVGAWTRVPSGIEVEIADGAAATFPEVYDYVAGDAFVARKAAGGVMVEWESVRTLDVTPAPLPVRRDIQGVRVEDVDDMHLAVRHRRSRGADVVRGAAPLVVRRPGDAAELSTWVVE